MNVKPFLLSIAALCMCVSVFAQDKIYKNNGDVMDVHVKEVGTKTITYKKSDNPDGPEYTISKDDIEKIKYQNGTEDTFNDDYESFHHHRPMPPHMRHIKPSDMHYGKNVLAAAPLQFSENGIGFGLTYERVLDRNGIVSFYLPTYITFNPNQDYGYNNNPNTMFYVAPGIKVYPTGCYGKIRYAIGPSLVIGTGTTSDYYYNGYYSGYENRNHFVLGMIVNNSMNINPTPHLYLGLELGMGASYVNQVDGFNQDIEFLVQTAFRIGYRF